MPPIEAGQDLDDPERQYRVSPNCHAAAAAAAVITARR